MKSSIIAGIFLILQYASAHKKFTAMSEIVVKKNHILTIWTPHLNLATIVRHNENTNLIVSNRGDVNLIGKDGETIQIFSQRRLVVGSIADLDFDYTPSPNSLYRQIKGNSQMTIFMNDQMPRFMMQNHASKIHYFVNNHDIYFILNNTKVVFNEVLRENDRFFNDVGTIKLIKGDDVLFQNKVGQFYMIKNNEKWIAKSVSKRNNLDISVTDSSFRFYCSYGKILMDVLPVEGPVWTIPLAENYSVKFYSENELYVICDDEFTKCNINATFNGTVLATISVQKLLAKISLVSGQTRLNYDGLLDKFSISDGSDRVSIQRNTYNNELKEVMKLSTQDYSVKVEIPKKKSKRRAFIYCQQTLKNNELFISAAGCSGGHEMTLSFNHINEIFTLKDAQSTLVLDVKNQMLHGSVGSKFYTTNETDDLDTTVWITDNSTNSISINEKEMSIKYGKLNFRLNRDYAEAMNAFSTKFWKHCSDLNYTVLCGDIWTKTSLRSNKLKSVRLSSQNSVAFLHMDGSGRVHLYNMPVGYDSASNDNSQLSRVGAEYDRNSVSLKAEGTELIIN